MTRFIIRRLLYSIPVLFGIVLARVHPGAGHPGRPVHGRPRREGHPRDRAPQFDRPVSAWTSRSTSSSSSTSGALAQGDLGSSIRFGRPVTDILVERLPGDRRADARRAALRERRRHHPRPHLGHRRNSPVDVGTMVVANLGVSTPVFVLGLVLAFLFAVLLKDTPFALPPSGRLSAGVTSRRWPRHGASRA